MIQEMRLPGMDLWGAHIDAIQANVSKEFLVLLLKENYTPSAFNLYRTDAPRHEG